MKRRLVVSRQAETDLILIWVYYAEENPSAADRLRQEIVSKYNRLLVYPNIGRSRDELQAGVRSLPVANHIIFYREVADRIKVLRVLHGAQDATSEFPSGDDWVENEAT